jgi:ketosteroid isomerase-like protein
MPNRLWIVIACLALVFASGSRPSATESVPEQLRRQTQELLDATSTGSAAVWDKYLDADVRYVDENGSVMTKKQMIEQTKPLPEGVSGSIQATNFDVAVHGHVAVLTYVDDEHEDYHGHKLHCQYRTTDTWMKTAAGWRLIAGQVLALRTDPPAIALDAALRDEYCGRYALTPGITYEIRRRGDALEGERAGRKAEELRAEAPDVLFAPGNPRYRKIFLRGPDGRVSGFAERREAWDIVWTKLP